DVFNLYGFSITRLNLGVYMLHPDIAGVAFQWHDDQEGVLSIPVDHASLETSAYLKSPIYEAVSTRQTLRVPLVQAVGEPYPVVSELRAAGGTDYGVFPLPGGSGRVNVWSVMTTKPGGFSEEDWHALQNVTLYLSLVVDYFAVQWLAGVLMQVYLGRRTGQRVLDGQVKRGDGQRIQAALWYCDMREFTKISTQLSSEELIVLLNQYFGYMGDSVRSHQGEILKFIGDAMLAIFPVDESQGGLKTACHQCLSASKHALASLAEWSGSRQHAGLDAIRSGIGLDVGEVVYGNIGTPGRLDFTVIGTAVNRVSRVEAMCSKLGESLLATGDFTALLDAPCESLGNFDLKGISAPVEIFRYPG
ncbi:MAG: adenylate/guanylate cyclase domain-containing protein, partial [Myxococcota bacterium]|nr:adenylate/guanylate cyclase domain-containing protein [Myxococcota bacterium]